MGCPGDDILKLHRGVDAKVREIFAELGSERATKLDFQPDGGEETIQDILTRALEKDYDDNAAWEIAFHLMDWKHEAAFLVALVMFPERFTKEEISAKVASLLCHAPNHIMAATHWAGFDLGDTFGLGLKSA